MTLDLVSTVFYIGIKVMIFSSIAIGLIISACVFVNFIITKGWSDDFKTPRAWKKADEEKAEKWGQEWLKLKKTKERKSRL